MFKVLKDRYNARFCTKLCWDTLALTLFLCVWFSARASAQSAGWSGTALQFASASSTYAGPAVALTVASESGAQLGNGMMREDGTFDITFDLAQVTAGLRPISEVCAGTEAAGQLLLTTVAAVSDASSGEAYGQLQASSDGAILFHIYSPDPLNLRATCADGSSIDLSLASGWNLAEFSSQAGSPGLISLPSNAPVQWFFFPNELWMSRHLP